MRIAILGAGFIGRNYLNSCLDKVQCVRVFDISPCPEEYERRVDWKRGLFSDSDALRSAVSGVDVVFHFISTTVPGDIVDKNEELFSNVVHTIELLKMCVEEGVKRIVFISSSSVYGPQSILPIPETAATNPISSHGIHKLTIEKYLQLYKYEHGLDCKIMRLSNPYGKGQNIHGRQGIVAIVAGKLLSGEVLHVRGDGSIVRDYIHIDDVVRALQLISTTDAHETVFNIGDGKGITLSEVIVVVEDVCRRKIKIEYVEKRDSDITESVLDISRAKSALGYCPTVAFEDGIKRTFIDYGII